LSRERATAEKLIDRSAIVTHNLRDFAGAQSLDVKAVTPAQFMRTIKESSR
jgi:hypothetical protein